MLRYKFLLLTLTILVMVSAGEFVMRSFKPQPTFSQLDKLSPRFYRYSPIGIFDLFPGARARHLAPPDHFGRSEYDVHVAINRSGLRMDREVPERKGEGTWRISIIGDSFVFGYGVEADQAFPTVLERRLQHRFPNIEVLNRGFSMGPAPDTYYANLRSGDRFESDLAVVCLFVGNDIMSPAYDHWASTDERGLPTRVTIDNMRVDDLHRFREVETRWIYRLPVLRESHLAVALASLIQTRSASSSIAMRLNPSQMYGEDWFPELEASFDKTVRCLVGIRDLYRERGSEVLVVLLPHPQQLWYGMKIVGSDRQRRLVRERRAQPGDRNPQRRLRGSL